MGDQLHWFHIPGQLPFLSAHWGPQSLQHTPDIVRVRQEVVGELGEEVGEEVVEELGETVGLVKSWDWSSPLLVRLAARTQLEDVVHSTFTWVVTVSFHPIYSNVNIFISTHLNPYRFSPSVLSHFSRGDFNPSKLT